MSGESRVFFRELLGWAPNECYSSLSLLGGRWKGLSFLFGPFKNDSEIEGMSDKDDKPPSTLSHK